MLVEPADLARYSDMYCSTIQVIRELIVENSLNLVKGVSSTSMIDDSPGVSSIVCPNVSSKKDESEAGIAAAVTDGSEDVNDVSEDDSTEDGMIRMNLLPIIAAFATGCVLVVGLLVTFKRRRQLGFDRENPSYDSGMNPNTTGTEGAHWLRLGSMEVA